MTDKKTDNQFFKKQKRKLTFYDDEFKRKVIAVYLDGNASKEAIQKKYGIKSDSGITQWMRKFGIADPFANYRGLRQYCRLFGVTRQSFYQHFRAKENKSFHNEMILQQVKMIREEHPRMGARKLMVMLYPFLLEHQITLGRKTQKFDRLWKSYVKTNFVNP